MKLDKYFLENIISVKEIKGHFNQNFKVTTTSGTFHLKIFNDHTHQIRHWIKGHTIKAWTEQNIKLVCYKLKHLHEQKHSWQKMDYRINAIADKHYQKLLTKYQTDMWVPCHNDLNKDNVIINSDQAFLIDFEFKRLNNRYWDLANIINEDQLGPKEIQFFLKHYQGLQSKKLLDFIYINKVFNNYWKQKQC